MDEMKVFENSEFGCLEVLWEGEKAYFPAIDCAKILGYTNPRKAIRDHCKGGTSRSLLTNGGIQEKKYISEGDLYRLIVRSKLEAAQRFERWVFDEVLPDIRRQGFHITTEALERLLSDPETAIRTFTALKEERDKNRALTEENRILTQKCGYLDLITACTDAVPITVIAKDYGMSGREMNRLLHNLGVQFQLQCGTWVLYQKYANHGYTRSRTIVYDDVHCRSAVHTYWTQRGRRFLYEFLKERGHLPLCEKGGDADEDSGKPEKPPYVKEISENVSDMQAVVGGYIEAVYFEEKGDALIFCNDEFLLNGSQPNRIVGELLIHGTFFVVGDTTNSIGEHVSCSLTDEQIEKYTEQFTPMVQQLTPQEVLAILFGMEEESPDLSMM